MSMLTTLTSNSYHALKYVTAMSTHTTLTSNSYHSKYVWFISLLNQTFIKISSLSCCRIYNKRKQTHKQKKKKPHQQAEQQHNHLVSISVFVSESYLFCVSWVYVELWRVEINNIIRVVCELWIWCVHFKLWILVGFPCY